MTHHLSALDHRTRWLRAMLRGRSAPPVTAHAPAPESDYRPALRAQMIDDGSAAASRALAEQGRKGPPFRAIRDDCGLSQASGAIRLAEALYQCRVEAYRLQHRPWLELDVDTKRRYVDIASLLLPILHPQAETPTISDLQSIARINSGAASWWALMSLGASLKGVSR